MKSRTRYGLIALWFTVFAIGAPLVYMFVTGTKWDSKNHRFIKTGIIQAKTDPGGAKIYLNDKLAGTTSSTLRFLDSGDYNIKIAKAGYFNWTKRLTVRTQYVTSIIKDLDTLYLFKEDQQQTHIQDQVISFQTGKNKIIYLTPDRLFFANTETPSNSQQLNLPHSFDKLSILGSVDENNFALYNQNFFGVFSASENKLYDLSEFMAGYEFDTAQFGDDGNLYALKNGTLAKIIWKEQKTENLLENIRSFQLQSNNIYYIKALTSGRNELAAAQMPNLQENILIASVPSWAMAKMYITNQSQIFILADATLYVVTDHLKQVANFVTDVKLYDAQAKLMFATNNEINFYNYFNGGIDFVTRSSKEIISPVAVPQLGWVFYINDYRLQNIEMDNRDHQNNYTFAPTTTDSKFAINNNASVIFLLRNNTLTALQIR